MDMTSSATTTAVILAGGMGTRLQELTNDDNIHGLKPLVNFDGKPLIEHIINAACEGGIRNFVIVAGYQSEHLQEAMASLNLQDEYGVNIEFVTPAEWHNGQGASLYAAKEAVGDNNFILTMSDHLVDSTIIRQLRRTDPVQGVVLAVDTYATRDNPYVDWDDVTKVRRDREGNITAIGKTLVSWQTNAFDTGFFHCSPALFDALGELLESTGKPSLSDAIRKLGENNAARTMEIPAGSRWIDADTPDMLKLAQSYFLPPIREQRETATNLCTLLSESGRCIAHRGGHKGHPDMDGQSFGNMVENNRPAFDHAIELAAGNTPSKASVIEFDVQLTKEGLEALERFDPNNPDVSSVPEWANAFVIYHSDPRYLDEGTHASQRGFSLLKQTGEDAFVYEKTMAELSSIPVGIPATSHGGEVIFPEGPQVSLVSFVDFLQEYVLGKGCYCQIELQPHCDNTYDKRNLYTGFNEAAWKEGAMVAAIIQAVLGEQSDHCMVLSTSPSALYGARHILPDMPAAFLASKFNTGEDHLPANIAEQHERGVTAIHFASPDIVTPRTIQQVRDSGLQVIVGGCNTPEMAKAVLSWGAIAVSADNYEEVLSVTACREIPRALSEGQDINPAGHAL